LDRLRRPAVLDALFAVFFTAAMVGILHKLDAADDETRAVDAFGYTLVLVAGLSLAWRRRFPTTVLAITTVALSVFVAREYPGSPAHLAPVVAMFTVASLYERPRWIPRVGAAALWLAVAGIVATTELIYFVLYFSWAIAAGFVGDAARSRREYLQGLEERNRQLVETHEEEARRRVAEERLRIARDLHDVVAHSLSSINIQAGAGAHVARRHPEQAEQALQAIKHASKDALDDLRLTVGMLRADDEAAPRTPQPTLGRLGTLVERTAAAGLDVDVRVHGDPTPLPVPVDAAAFRIVQESLTNVLRHAGPARAFVTIAYSNDGVDVDVTDTGIGPHNGANGGGHGLAGMRERAEAIGGRVDAGPAPGGGFRVHAHLPAHPEVSA
jgi:signal transduction histidine kinase